ncbi:MAG TPA: VOC family protein [Gemmatimonadaceae bacterium]|nr:VOC family protein [Gemmatimonadaceae bacterium]
MHGQFVWYELTTPDPAAAQQFYPAITGWGTQAFDADYTMWTSRGVPYAGIFRLGPEQQEQGVPPNWMPYIESSDVDETARLARSLGGAVVVEPGEIPDVGRFAVLRDPQGATFGIYRSHRASRAWDGSQVPGQFSWHELMATDYTRAFAFYQRLFGWEKIDEMDMGDGFTYFMYGKGGKMYGGMFNRPPEMGSMPPFWLSYIFVKNVQQAVDIATKRGATLVRGPMPIPGGMIAILADPQGAGFAVHHADAPAAAPAERKPASRAAQGAARPTAAGGAKTTAKGRAKAKARPKAAAKKSLTAKRRRAAKKRVAKRVVKRRVVKKRVVKRRVAKRRVAKRRVAKKRVVKRRVARRRVARKSAAKRRPSKASRRAGARRRR